METTTNAPAARKRFREVEVVASPDVDAVESKRQHHQLLDTAPPPSSFHNFLTTLLDEDDDEHQLTMDQLIYGSPTSPARAIDDPLSSLMANLQKELCPASTSSSTDGQRPTYTSPAVSLAHLPEGSNEEALAEATRRLLQELESSDDDELGLPLTCGRQQEEEGKDLEARGKGDAELASKDGVGFFWDVYLDEAAANCSELLNYDMFLQ